MGAILDLGVKVTRHSAILIVNTGDRLYGHMFNGVYEYSPHPVLFIRLMDFIYRNSEHVHV